jgi:hypothetical protein
MESRLANGSESLGVSICENGVLTLMIWKVRDRCGTLAIPQSQTEGHDVILADGVYWCSQESIALVSSWSEMKLSACGPRLIWPVTPG